MAHFLSNKHPKRAATDQKLGDVILELLEKYQLKNKLFEQHIFNAWEKIVGKTIHKHTTGLNVIDKKLIISLNSAALREELMLGKTKIRDLINQELGVEFIEEVIIR